MIYLTINPKSICISFFIFLKTQYLYIKDDWKALDDLFAKKNLE